MSLNVENEISNVEEKLLLKSLKILLEDFGEGNATPGSGKERTSGHI